MATILLGMAIWSTLFLIGTTVLGFLGSSVGVTVHMLAGIFTAIFGILTHSLVFIHTIGAGKWINETMEKYDHPDEETFIKKKKWLMAQLIPLASFGTLSLMATAIFGGAIYRNASPIWIHSLLALITLVVNLFSFAHEIRIVAENKELLAEIETGVDELLDQKEAATNEAFETAVDE